MKNLVLLKPTDILPKSGIVYVVNQHGNHIGNIFIIYNSNAKAGSRYLDKESSTKVLLPYLGGKSIKEVRDIFKDKFTLLTENPVYKNSLYVKSHKSPLIKKLTKYILWCPTSHLPPRVILEGIDKAREVAKDMTERHGSKFIICELKESYSRKKTVTTTYEIVSKPL